MRSLRFLLPLVILLFFTSTGSSQKIPDDCTIIRVLTYNILHGATTERNNDLNIVAEVINKLEPDLVALQEMDFRTNRVQKRDINTELALKTGMNSKQRL